MSDDTSRELTVPLTRKWSDRFALDFAMTLEGSGSKPAELLKEYEYTPTDLELFSKDPLFMKRVEHFQVQLKEKGFTFKLKAQAQAELLLDTSWKVIHTDDVSAAVKADLIKWTAKMAGYEPEKASGAEGGGGVKINIIMGGDRSPPQTARIIDND